MSACGSHWQEHRQDTHTLTLDTLNHTHITASGCWQHSSKARVEPSHTRAAENTKTLQTLRLEYVFFVLSFASMLLECIWEEPVPLCNYCSHKNSTIHKISKTVRSVTKPSAGGCGWSGPATPGLSHSLNGPLLPANTAPNVNVKTEAVTHTIIEKKLHCKISAWGMGSPRSTMKISQREVAWILLHATHVQISNRVAALVNANGKPKSNSVAKCALLPLQMMWRAWRGLTGTKGGQVYSCAAAS